MPDKSKIIEVDKCDDDIRLDRWFKRHYPFFPHSKLQQMLRKGHIKLDDEKTLAGTHLKAGQKLRLPDLKTKDYSNPNKPKNTIVLSSNQRKEFLKAVLYKDKKLIAFNKPAGLAVQGGTKTFKHLDAMLDELTFEEPHRPRLVHRLDKDTSGVLLLARNPNAAAELTRHFRNRKMKKTYWALVVGAPKLPQGNIIDEIEGLAAETNYEVIEHIGKKLAWIAFRPITGRKHQIRIHAQKLGCPIIGDTRYNKLGEESLLADFETNNIKLLLGDNPPLHLHARALELPSKQIFIAPSPPHMIKTWDIFGFDKTIA